MADEAKMNTVNRIDARIILLRGQRIMLDADLAEIYGVQTKRLLEQYSRNRDRFPEDFAFQLTAQEFANMRSQSATALKRNTRHRPYAFTEHGAIMLASILNSSVAIEASIRVVRAFVFLREQIGMNKELARKFSELEKRLDGHDESLAALFEAIRQLLEPTTEKTKREIGFHMQEQAVRYRTRNGN